MSVETAQEVHLHPQGDTTKASLASKSSTAKVLGKVCSDLKIQGRDYSNIILELSLNFVLILFRDITF